MGRGREQGAGSRGQGEVGREQGAEEGGQGQGAGGGGGVNLKEEALTTGWDEN